MRFRCNFCNDLDEPLEMELTWEEELKHPLSWPLQCPRGHTPCGDECCGCYFIEVEDETT